MTPPARRRLRRPALGRRMRRADRPGADAAWRAPRRSRRAPARARSTRRAPATACSSSRPSSRSAPASRQRIAALLRLAARERRGPADPALPARAPSTSRTTTTSTRPSPARRRILKRGGQRVGLARLLPQHARGRRRDHLPGRRPRGRAGPAAMRVFFSYDRPHPATRTLHGGAPVDAGEKWVAAKWLREGKFEQRRAGAARRPPLVAALAAARLARVEGGDLLDLARRHRARHVAHLRLRVVAARARREGFELRDRDSPFGMPSSQGVPNFWSTPPWHEMHGAMLRSGSPTRTSAGRARRRWSARCAPSAAYA